MQFLQSKRKSKIFLASSILAMAITIALVSFGYIASQSQNNLEPSSVQISVLDIGQGDAILIRNEQNQNILIDTGPGRNILFALDRVWQQNQQIDVLVITHPDLDHAAGAIDLIEKGLVKSIWTNGSSKNSKKALWLDIAKQAANYNIPISYLDQGSQFNFGCCILINTVWPVPLKYQADTNENSLSLLVSYGEFDFLAMGDLASSYESKVANYLTQIDATLDLEVLKVSHHGSKNSSGIKVLESFSPQAAVISAGRNNRYGHPTSQVLQNLTSIGATIWRTDLSGTIIIQPQQNGEFTIQPKD